VQDEAHLIGERRAAVGAVGGELTLVRLDQVLGLAARTIEGVVFIASRMMVTQVPSSSSDEDGQRM
jgi:hypothetical protein